jgi:adenylate cyclase class 2
MASNTSILQPEIEAKFVMQHPMRLMRRVLIEEEHHAAENSFIRIRDEGDKVTLTFKRRAKSDTASTIDSTQELETTVGNFDATVNIFKEAGWDYITYQESRRETWTLGEVEVVIDEWPWIQPYIEIEAGSIALVQDAAKTLGFTWDEAVFGSVDVIYGRDFPDMSVRGIIDVKEAHFDQPVPNEFGSRKA